MPIIRWRPFKEIEDFFDNHHRSFNGDLAVDVYEDEDSVMVEMSTAGIDPDKIDIEVEDNHLRVSGKRDESTETEDKDFYHKEIRRGSFERVVALPSRVDSGQATAEFEHGILKISLPKTAGKEPNKIKVTKK